MVGGTICRRDLRKYSSIITAACFGISIPSQPLRTLNTPPLSLLHIIRPSKPNIFGVTLRHLRYLGLRRRILSTTQEQYGRLSAADVPRGELKRRTCSGKSTDLPKLAAGSIWKFRYDDQLAAGLEALHPAAAGTECGAEYDGRNLPRRSGRQFSRSGRQPSDDGGLPSDESVEGCGSGNFLALSRSSVEWKLPNRESNNFTVLDVMRRPELKQPSLKNAKLPPYSTWCTTT
jgi:hypothetical protein